MSISGSHSHDPQATVITPRAAEGKRPEFDGTGGESPRFAPGDRLGDFEVVGLVGGGGMGRVYRARDVRLSRMVALKVLSPDQAHDANTVARFENEAQSAAQLDHQNIARVYQVGEERGIPFIAFEFIEGMNVRDLVGKKGPLPLTEVLGYVLQVVEALAHAASRNVVHRDIKPSNLIVTPDGTAKLIDLGLARLNRLEGPSGDLTSTGVTLGTFDYISPEQARDPRTADIRSDIYSLGCTCFFMLTGRPPFPEGTMLQKLLQHQGDQPPDVREFRRDLPEELSRILRKMLAKDPRHRYQHPAELLEELLRLAQEVGLRPLRAGGDVWLTARAPKIPFWQQHLPWAAPALALLVIVLALDFLSTPRGEDRGLPPAAEIVKDRHAATASGTLPLSVAPAISKSGQAAALVGTIAAAGSGEKGVAASSGASNPPASIPAAASGAGSLLASAANSAAAHAAPIGEAQSVARPAGSHAGVLYVGEAPAGETAYASLNAACSQADCDVVEIRCNGPSEQRPLMLTNRKLTIRAGEGFHPLLVFRPMEGGVPHPQSMVSVSGGQLSLVNMAVELQIPAEVPAENWSLFEWSGGEGIRLENCWLTIHAAPGGGENPPEASFFRFSAAPGDELAAADRPSGEPPALDLANCVVRGDGIFLRTESQQPLQATWENGLFAGGSWLFSAEGGVEPPRSGERRLELRHVTAATTAGLCRMKVTPSAPHQLVTTVFASDSIFCGAATAAMVEMTGLDSAEDCRRWLQWNGDRNFYEGWEVFWSINTADAKTPKESLNFEAWQHCWGPEKESQPARNEVVWNRFPDATRPRYAQTPADYELSADAGKNPARGAARNGVDVGFSLPQLPAAPMAGDRPAGK